MSKGEATRQFIIEKAAPIFNKKGIAATAMSDIMDATKLAKGSLYVHFENKDVLAAEVVDHNLNLGKKKLQAALNIAGTSKEKLFTYIDVVTDILNPPVPGGCPMINFGMEADDTNPEIKQKINQAIESTQQWISDIIKQGIKAGEFRPDWNHKEFATIMFAMLEGGIVIGRVAGNNTKIKAIGKALRQMISSQQLT
jgi:AcrR family transcriptional regulator